HVEHRAAGLQGLEVTRDDAVAGDLVEAAHELPMAAAVLLLPDVLRHRRIATASGQLPGVDPRGEVLREGETPPEEELVIQDVDQLERPAGEPAQRLHGGCAHRRYLSFRAPPPKTLITPALFSQPSPSHQGEE